MNRIRTPAGGVEMLDERVTRLEDRHDELADQVSDVRVVVGEMNGKLDAVLGHLQRSLSEQHQTERVRIGSRAKVIVGVVGALCTAAGAIVAAIASGCS